MDGPRWARILWPWWHLVWSGHVSGLLCAVGRPLAPMGFADRVSKHCERPRRSGGDFFYPDRGYEAKHHPIPAPDLIAAILFMMEQKGLTRCELEPAIGSPIGSPKFSAGSGPSPSQWCAR